MSGEHLRLGARSWLFLIAVCVVWFAMLGYRDLIDPDEGRYAEIPREMLVSGDWVTPRLDGLKYFEKPPLQYWATALTFRLLGESNLSARLWVAVAGFAGALWTAWLGARLFGARVGALAFILTASGLLYVAMGHVLTLDMSLAVFLTLALGSLALAQTRRAEPGQLRGWMLVAWAALAAAVLTKGLVGLVLPAGAVGIYLLWMRDWTLLRHLHIGKGLLLFVALTAPWFVAVSRANPGFAEFFFVHEHLQRFTTDTHGRDGPIYYFVGILLVGALPWTLLTLRALLRPGFRPRYGSAFQPERLFWIYVLLVLVFFSVSHSKLPAYILPIWPFAALLASRYATTLVRWRADAWAVLAFAALLIGLSLMAPRFATDNTPVALLEQFRPWVLAAAGGFTVTALLLLFWRGSVTGAMASAALTAMLSVQMLAWGAQALAPSRSGRELAEAIDRLPVASDVPLYFVGHYSPSLAFYLGRVPTIVEYHGELAFGIQAEPGRTIDNADSFAARWRGERQAVAVVASRRDGYLALGLPMQVQARGPRRTLVVRNPVAPATDELPEG